MKPKHFSCGKTHEQIRSEIARKYNSEIRELKSENSELKSQNKALLEENENLKSELAAKSEWIERLQEFCNMSEEDRLNLLESETVKKDAFKALKILAVGPGYSYLSEMMKI